MSNEFRLFIIDEDSWEICSDLDEGKETLRESRNIDAREHEFRSLCTTKVRC